MIKRTLLTLFIFCSIFSKAQNPGEWMWVSGTDTLDSPGAFEVQGIPSVNAHPPGLYEFCDFKDKQGNFWVYGGWAFDFYADLWKYNPVTNEWTWVKGDGQTFSPTIYGTQGVPDPSNTPGQRDICSATWVDTSGNFWLFGGYIQNDLWKYDISTNEWTWMSGTTSSFMPGNYGTIGVAAPSNIPGGRSETCSAWTDDQNNLWLFGGYGMDDDSIMGCLNDIWKYNISTNEWTWVNGSNLIGQPGAYGIKGVSSPANHPGSRCTYTKWKDLQNNFWIMGGLYYDNTNYQTYSDVWEYNVSSNEWTWMAGPQAPNDQGTYQTNCVFDTINQPMSRYEHRASVTDNCGKFWLFGGDSESNDQWVFDPVQLKWNWVNGTNIFGAGGNFGIKGVSSPTNQPPGRMGAMAWWGNDNKFYLFGGGFMNGHGDMWVFNPDTNCISRCTTLPVSSFMTMNHLCPGTCTDFTNLSLNGTSFQWAFPGGTPSSSTDVNPQNICYSTPGSYDVQLIATNANGSDTLLLSNYITVYPTPPPQSIIQNGDTLFANAGAASYQWYFNGNIIPGATNYFYIAPGSGDYNLVATDGNGCEVEAAIFNVIANLSPEIKRMGILIYPNPVIDKLTIQTSLPATMGIKDETAAEIAIYNLFGEKIFAACLPNTHCLLPAELDLHAFPPGIYFIRIKVEDSLFNYKLVKI